MREFDDSLVHQAPEVNLELHASNAIYSIKAQGVCTNQNQDGKICEEDTVKLFASWLFKYDGCYSIELDMHNGKHILITENDFL